MNEESKIKPPYVSYGTFKNFLGSIKELIPARIDPTHPFMVGQSGSAQSFLMSALRFFGLVDGKTPTPCLKQLAQSSDEDRKGIWKAIFTEAYAPIIGDVDLTTATAGMLHEKFREQDLTGETVNKCFSFFVAGAQDAGIPLAKHLEPGARGGGNGTRKARRPRAANTGKPTEENAEHHDDGGAGGPKMSVATLLLAPDGSRMVKLHAPPTVSPAELDRIQKWLSFQLIVEDAAK